MRRIALFMALLVPALAHAQMMDPRQASGVPRPDPAVAAGTLTVKVLLGEVGVYAAAGTPVHLVAMAGDGSVKLTTVRVNDEGRAEFTGLATDGKTGYYALCILGDDRLVSQATVLPPKIGVRLMLAGHKKGAAAVDDERQAHEGVADAPALPAAGEVEIMARGQVGTSAKTVLRELASGTTRDLEVKGSEGMLSGTLTGIPGGPEKVYVAEVPAGGKVHRSTPFMLSTQAGARRMVLVYDGLLMAVQGGAQADDESMSFEMSLTVANLGGAPIDTGPDGLLIPLPVGFRGTTIEDENSPFKIDSERGLRYRGPVPPGQLSVTVQFALRAQDGRVKVDMPSPTGLFQSQMAVGKSGDIKIEAPKEDFEAPQVRRSDDGREYWVLENFNVAPGQSMRFAIVGLPIPDKWHAWAGALVGALVLVLVAFAVAVAVRRPRKIAARPGGVAASADARRELRARRERLYTELVALERARLQQRVDGGAFEAQRKVIMTKLVLVHRELDDLDGLPIGGKPGGQARAS